MIPFVLSLSKGVLFMVRQAYHEQKSRLCKKSNIFSLNLKSIQKMVKYNNYGMELSMNYWIMVASPDKWFCENCHENANVNDTLLNLTTQPWRVREDYFQNAKIGDKCIIKISKDNRSIGRRTLENGEVVDVLESGIYGLAEIVKELYFDEEDQCHRVTIRITKNLFQSNEIIEQDMAEKILGNDFISQSSKKIEEKKYQGVLSIIDIEENSEFEDDEDLQKNNEQEDLTLYPADVKIQRDMFSVRELKTEYKEKKLVLAPDFQRELVWTLKQKSELIESILMGIPLPMIYFFEGDEGIIQVVDGKQRLTSLFEFLDNLYPLSQSLKILPHLRGKKYSDLEPAEQTKIARHQFVTQTIIPPTPDKIKFDIFERVNRKGSMLNNQEMRNALYQGKSTHLLNKLAKNKSFLKATGNGISPTRMKDRYIILRFIAFYLWREKQLFTKKGESVEYKSDIDEFVGATMDHINRLDNGSIEQLEQMFNRVMEIAYKLGGEDVFRIPGNERKRPINMSLLESLGYFFSKIDINKDNNLYKRKIQELLMDKEYMTALTVRIDSSPSVKIRFDKVDTLLTGFQQ